MRNRQKSPTPAQFAGTPLRGVEIHGNTAKWSMKQKNRKGIIERFSVVKNAETNLNRIKKGNKPIG